jgi:hypothetical protein
MIVRRRPTNEKAVAGALNSLSLRWGEPGRQERGFTAMEEAVEIHRRLRVRWPQTYHHVCRSNAV